MRDDHERLRRRQALEIAGADADEIAAEDETWLSQAEERDERYLASDSVTLLARATRALSRLGRYVWCHASRLCELWINVI